MLFLVDNCTNHACTRHADTAHYKMIEHSKTFRQGIYRVADIFYLAVGYGIANVTMIEGIDGVIIIDTCESFEVAQQIRQDFLKITDKPIKAVIYTHNHIDHIGGVKGFVSKQEVDNGSVKIYANRRIIDGVVSNANVVGNIINIRAVYTFGMTLETNCEGHVNDGIGPKFIHGRTTFIHPTDMFDDVLEIEVAGIKMCLYYAPSETNDEIFIHFPDHGVVQSADIIMGQSYPNIHTIRGTPYRDPVQWYESIDLIRNLKPAYLIPSHGNPLEGVAEVHSMLTAYRDAIQFTHDQAVRFINKGYVPDELVEAVPCLPEYLQKHEWLQEFYGTVKHSVRQIYYGYLGWFEGDPTFLDPLTRHTRAKLYIDAMGGHNRVVAMIESAIQNANYKWAAELATHLIEFDVKDLQAKLLKSHCLRQLGYACINTNWRNWYLTSACELDGTLNYGKIELAHGVNSDDIIAEIPTDIFLKRLCTHIDPEKSIGVHMTFGFQVDDQLYTLEIRQAVVEYHKVTAGKQLDHRITLSDSTLRNIFLRRTTIRQAHDDGLISFCPNTDLPIIMKFFSYFDLACNVNIPLTQPHMSTTNNMTEIHQ